MIETKEGCKLFLNKNVLIVGLARTGLTAASLLARYGCNVTISEKREIKEMGDIIQELKNLNLKYEFGGHQEKTFLNKDWILLSPGVPMNIPPCKESTPEKNLDVSLCASAQV